MVQNVPKNQHNSLLNRYVVKNIKFCWKYCVHNDEAKCYLLDKKEAYVRLRKEKKSQIYTKSVFVIMLILVFEFAK